MQKPRDPNESASTEANAERTRRLLSRNADTEPPEVDEDGIDDPQEVVIAHLDRALEAITDAVDIGEKRRGWSKDLRHGCEGHPLLRVERELLGIRNDLAHHWGFARKERD